MPAQTVSPAAEVSPEEAPVVEKPAALPVPSKVYTLAGGSVTEFDLTQKPFLYRENMDVPDYFAQYNIDANTLKTAQANMARVFERDGYVIISPVQTTTMGEIKRVFGILDGVIGKEPSNELNTRPQTAGSDGNLDNAIIGPEDAIIIKKYDKDMGHQVGVYTAHKSNKSRQKIVDEIILWANK